MENNNRKKVRREDLLKMRDLAENLNNVRSKKVRMDMQQDFVRDMAQIYGHENATHMLTRVWKLADRLREGEEEAYV